MMVMGKPLYQHQFALCVIDVVICGYCPMSCPFQIHSLCLSCLSLVADPYLRGLLILLYLLSPYCSVSTQVKRLTRLVNYSSVTLNIFMLVSLCLLHLHPSLTCIPLSHPLQIQTHLYQVLSNVKMTKNKNQMFRCFCYICLFILKWVIQILLLMYKILIFSFLEYPNLLSIHSCVLRCEKHDY